MTYQDPMKPDPREGNLPKWAQGLLGDMRRRTLDAEKGEQEARLATDPVNSDMIIDRYGKTPIGLGKGHRLRVTCVLTRDHDDDPLDWVDFRLSDQGHGLGRSVEVSASSTLNIQPQVTNVIYVWPRSIGGKA
jgi:hypothetical protein